MIRRTILCTAGALGVALPLLTAPAAVSAEEPGSALVSVDGESFQRSLEGGILPADTLLIPGGTSTGVFYVKNDTGRGAELRISVAGASSASVTLLDELRLQAATPATPDSTPVSLSSDSSCIPLLTGELLHSDQVTVVRITLAMDADAGNVDQGQDANAGLVVSLTDPTAPDSAESDCTDGGGIPLLPEPSPLPHSEPDEDRPVSETTDMVPPVDAPQPTAAAEPEDTDPNATGETPPAAETPPTAGDLPPVASASGVPLPLLGTGGLALGAGAFLLARRRRRRAD